MTQSLPVGTQLGPYRIVRLIGAGGMGEVYEAFEEALHRRVAVKLLIDAQGANGSVEVGNDSIARFLQEARTLAQINHPNIVSIYSVNKTAEQQFIAMEYVEGMNMRDFLDRYVLSADEAIPLFAQVLDGLKVLHENNIIHRDLKPANLIVRPDGHIKIIDFGIAKQMGERNHKTATGHVMGTVQYMAPELLYGAPATVLSDLWSLGAIFYECVSGCNYLERKQATLETNKLGQVIFPKECFPWVPMDLRRVIGSMCAHDPMDRYNSASRAIEEVRKVSLGRPPRSATMFVNLVRNVQNLEAMNAQLAAQNIAKVTAKRVLTVSVKDHDFNAGQPKGSEATQVTDRSGGILLSQDAVRTAAVARLEELKRELMAIEESQKGRTLAAVSKELEDQKRTLHTASEELAQLAERRQKLDVEAANWRKDKYIVRDKKVLDIDTELRRLGNLINQLSSNIDSIKQDKQESRAAAKIRELNDKIAAAREDQAKTTSDKAEYMVTVEDEVHLEDEKHEEADHEMEAERADLERQR